MKKYIRVCAMVAMRASSHNIEGNKTLLSRKGVTGQIKSHPKSKEKKLDILILADFLGNITRENNSRFMYLANVLCQRHNVELVTGDFDHGLKKYYNRDQISHVRCAHSYQITFLHEGAYPKNVCLKRFVGHYIWGKSVKRYLKQRKKPDVVYCGIPTLSAALEAAKYCEKNNIRCIIDVQDLWPEAFRMVFHMPVLSGFIFLPFKIMADGIYRRADEICAVSQTYVERAMRANRKIETGHSIFLGTKLEDFDGNVKKHHVKGDIKLPRKEGLWLGYCGTLGASYDLDCVIEALSIVQTKSVDPPKFIVMGQGEKRDALEKKCKERGVDVYFTGFIPYDQMCYVLKQCDMVVNPIEKGAAQSIINKHSDYAASGLPVLNTQEGQEYRKLIYDYKMGFNCQCGDSKDLAEKMIRLIQSESMRCMMGKNSRVCAEELFDRKKNYKMIVNIIESRIF